MDSDIEQRETQLYHYSVPAYAIIDNENNDNKMFSSVLNDYSLSIRN